MQLSLPRKEGIHFLLVFVVLGQAKLQVDVFILCQRVDHGLHTLAHDFAHRLLVVKVWLLRQVAHGVAGGKDHLPLVFGVEPRNNLH